MLRIISQIPIDSQGVTALRLPIDTRIFDAVLNERKGVIRLIINRPKEYSVEMTREFLVCTSPTELEAGKWTFIRSLSREDEVILHVFEKVR